MTLALQPTNLPEALAFLAAHPGATPLAGCTDLLVGDPLHRLGREVVIDLGRLHELTGIHDRGSTVEIGALVTMSELREDPTIRAHFPALADAAGEVGGWQIQNRATLGGNVANASPAGDTLPVLLALDATVLVAHANGPREIPYDQLHVGYRRTALLPGELIVGFRLAVQAAGTRQGFRKVGTRAAQAISKLVVATTVQVDNGVIVEIRIAAGSVAAMPVRLRATEVGIIGKPANATTADLAGELAASEVTPIDDVRSTAEYRRYALERVVRRLVLDLTQPATD